MQPQSPFSVESESRRLNRLFWFAIALSAATAGYAALNARDLAYDGSFYLLAIGSRRTFQLFEPARQSVQILQQAFVVFGIRFGVEDLWTLGRLFSLAMSGWPVVLTALCWFALPRDEKSWIAGPLVNLVFAIPAASFVGISEGMIASCLLWLAVLLVTFRLAHPMGALAAFIVSVACAVSHESALLCLVLVGWSAAEQFGRLKGMSRIASAAIAIVCMAGAVYMARWILMPRSATERGDFAASLLGGFLGLPGAPNLPALASVIAGVTIAIAMRGRGRLVTVFGCIAILACGIILASAPAALVSPSRFFAARGLPVALTTVTATLFLLLRRHKIVPAQFATRSAISILVALVVTQSLMQAVATKLWSEFVWDLRTLVAAKHGVISHAEAMAALDPDQGRFRRELLESWSVEPLSILLAPGGRITAVVEPAKKALWVPYRLAKPETLPRLPQLDWSGFPLPHHH